jgi:hypothetical protein
MLCAQVLNGVHSFLLITTSSSGHCSSGVSQAELGKTDKVMSGVLLPIFLCSLGWVLWWNKYYLVFRLKKRH